MSASMAEVVAQHVMFDADSCACDEMFYDYRLPAEQIKVEHSLHVEERLAANGYGKLEDATRLIRDLTDPDDCTFDHHGGCQAHGYLSLEPGEMCPQLEAKVWARNHRRPE